jgi:molybdate transport system substrate-binding protein
MRTSWLTIAVSAGVLIPALAGVVKAADVKVLSAVGMRHILDDLGPKFERATGHRLAITIDASGIIVKRIEAGESFDVVMVLRTSLERLTQSGKVISDSTADLASSIAAVAVRQGAPKPNISSPEAFKRTLLDAKLIARPPPEQGGASGVHIQKVLERLGIADEVKAKTVSIGRPEVLRTTPGYVVASGQADIALHQLQELLAVPGTEIVGPFPRELQDTFLFSAGVITDAKEPDAGNALISFLRKPDARAAIETIGMQPATR